MHSPHRLLLPLLYSILAWGAVVAQTNQRPTQRLPIKLAVLDQSIALPSFRLTEYPYNPAFIIGTEHLLKNKQRYDIHLTGNLGFYHHQHLRNALFLQTEIGYRRHFGRFSLAARAGVAYTHVFSTAPVYVFENGDYREGPNSGQPVFTPSVGIEPAFRLRRSQQAPELFLTYLFALDQPFAILPIPHVFVGGGIRFYPFQ